MNGKQLQDLGHTDNMDAAAAFVVFDFGAYMDGYADAQAHVCDMNRIDVDASYTDGYRKQAHDYVKRAELDLEDKYRDFQDQLETERDQLWQQRYGWQL